MSYIENPTFIRKISGDGVVRADKDYLSVDSIIAKRTLVCFDRKTAMNLRDAIDAWLKETGSVAETVGPINHHVAFAE